MAEAHVVTVGLAEFRRDVIMSIDESEATNPIKIFTHFGDGVYMWCSPVEAEEIALTLLGLVETYRERRRSKQRASQ